MASEQLAASLWHQLFAGFRFLCFRWACQDRTRAAASNTATAIVLPRQRLPLRQSPPEQEPLFFAAALLHCRPCGCCCLCCSMSVAAASAIAASTTSTTSVMPFVTVTSICTQSEMILLYLLLRCVNDVASIPAKAKRAKEGWRPASLPANRARFI